MTTTTPTAPTLAEKLAALKAKNAAVQAPVATPVMSAPAKTVAPVSQATQDKLAALRNKLVATPTPAAAPTTTGASTNATIHNSLLHVHNDMRVLEGFNPDTFVALLPVLANEIEAKAPGIGTYLAEINKNLSQYQELTHLLNDDQLSVICSGLFFLTDTQMLSAVTKKGSKAVLSAEQIEAMF